MSRAKDYRQKRAIPVTLPSGVEFLLRRPPVHTWLRNGRAPQLLTQIAFDATAREKVTKQTPEAAASQLSAEEIREMFNFQIDVVREAMVSPRLIVADKENATVADSQGDDDLALEELEPEDFLAVFRWVMTGSPSAPVQLADGGETTLAAVANFPEGGQGVVPVATGADVPIDGGEAQQALGAA